MYRSLIKHFFLTSKPYSYAGEISRGVLFALILLPSNLDSVIIISACISLLMWLYFNWQSDYIQRDRGRLQPPLMLFLFPFIIVSSIAYYLNEFSGLLGIVIYAISIILYSYKTKNKLLGLLGPILRLLNGLAFFVSLSLIFNLTVTSEALVIAFVVSFFLAIRNFVGDVRDINTDKYEFPARFGAKLSANIIRFSLMFLIIISIITQSKIINFYSILIVILSWITFELLILKFIYEKPDLWGYLFHRVLIISVTLFQLLLITMYLDDFRIYLFIIALLFITQPFYFYLPSKSFKKLKELF